MREGAFVGGLLTATLVAVSYLGWKLAGLPFVPFDLFDWLARELPGSVVTAAIESMVGISRVLHVGNMSTAAKGAEQMMAIAGTLAVGVVAASLLFGVLGFSDEPTLLLGAIFGAILGHLAVLVEQRVNRIASGSIVSVVWVVATFLAWGLAFGWIHDRLRRTDVASAAGTPTSYGSVGRRRFLMRVAYATGTPTLLTALWGLVIGSRRPRVAGARWSDDHPLANAGARVTPVAGTRPEFTRLEDHYRIDTNTRVPVIDSNRWRLRIGGLVDHPLELTLDDLRREEPLDQFVTLSCISNPIGGDLIGTTRWTGVSLQRLLGRLALQARATHLRITSADGFFESVPLESIQNDSRVMLTYAWDGVPLLAEHGFPLRIYLPDLYGMKQPKWIVSIDAIDRWEPGYWVMRGWDREGRMKATSVVDAVEVPNGRKMVAVGGIAHAGARRISKIEARVDDGEWREARIREPLSSTTWVVWRADLPPQEGTHVVGVRCYEGDGTPQVGVIHSKRTKLS